MKAEPEPVFWTATDPKRLARDLADVADFAPNLTFEAPPGTGHLHHGRWSGTLPIWPFERPRPERLDELITTGLLCEVYCSAAHPMTPPHIVPLSPEPEILERSQHVWHVAPHGDLCLLQTIGDWSPSASIVELLLKASAWRIEYALMKAGVVDSMSTNGIVDDPSRDSLVALAVTAPKAARPIASLRDRQAGHD
jgi:hypothetical protein